MVWFFLLYSFLLYLSSEVLVEYVRKSDLFCHRRVLVEGIGVGACIKGKV